MPTIENRLLQADANLKMLRLKHRALNADYRRLLRAARTADKTMRNLAYQASAWETLNHQAQLKLEQVLRHVEVLLDEDSPNTRLGKLIEARKQLKAWVAHVATRRK